MATATQNTPDQTWTGLQTFNGGVALNMTTGSVLFVGAAGAISQDNANFFWDDTNNRLGIGTASPQAYTHVKGATNTRAILETSVTGSGGWTGLELRAAGVFKGGWFHREGTVYDDLWDNSQICIAYGGGKVIVGALSTGATDNATGCALQVAGSGGISVNGVKVVGAQGALVANATDNASAITQLNALLARLRAHGLIAT